jgi:hypothetical protein
MIDAPFLRLFHASRQCSTREARAIHGLFFESQGESQGRDFSPLSTSESVSYPTAGRAFRLYLPSTSGLSRRRSWGSSPVGLGRHASVAHEWHSSFHSTSGRQIFAAPRIAREPSVLPPSSDTQIFVVVRQPREAAIEPPRSGRQIFAASSIAREPSASPPGSDTQIFVLVRQPREAATEPPRSDPQIFAASSIAREPSVSPP